MPKFKPGDCVYVRFEVVGYEENDRCAPKWAQWDGSRVVCMPIDKKGLWFNLDRCYFCEDAIVPAGVVKAEIQRAKDGE